MRVLYRSDTDTAAANSIRPSRERHFPSGPCTLFEIATWVCRSGSPARESQWWNWAAINPWVLIWA